MTHSEMETLIEREGREVARSMVQSHLELRGLAEPEEPPRGVDDVARRNHAAGTSRPLVSPLGPVTVGRTRDEQRGVPGLHPVDAELKRLDRFIRALTAREKRDCRRASPARP